MRNRALPRRAAPQGCRGACHDPCVTSTPPPPDRAAPSSGGRPWGDCVRVGLVGLGTIGRVHLRTLTALAGVEVVFTVDPAVPGAGDAGPVHRRTLDEALRLPGARPPDLVVVATPTDSHLPVVREALASSPALVLSEKPLARDRRALAAFLEDPSVPTHRVRVVDHVGFAPEVEWGVAYAAERGWGPPDAVLSSFTDPYGALPPERRAAYVSPWVDSGSNQLAVLGRFVDGWTVVDQVADDTAMRCSTRVALAGGGWATLVAGWRTGDSSKQTSLRWSGGRELFLDHTSMTGIVLDGGRTVEHLGHDASADRKTAHYRGMYAALLRSPDHPLLSLGTAVRVARALAADPTPGPQVRWRLRGGPTPGP